MAVYDQGFRAYRGPWTRERGRFWVLAKYALKESLGQRRTVVFLSLSSFVPLAAAVFIYLHHNAEALAILQIPLEKLLAIDARFFFRILQLQGGAAFLVFLAVGATLVSADLKDNALPLYLGRPISRLEYALGKFTVLAVLGSTVTWLPAFVLVGLQASLEGPGWLGANLRVPVALFAGSWVVIVLLGTVCLAVSALLKAKAAAEWVYVSVFVLSPVVGQALNESLRTEKGTLLHVPALLDSVWRALFGLTPSQEIAVLPASCSLAVMVLLAAVVLHRRIRAYEVVK